MIYIRHLLQNREFKNRVKNSIYKKYKLSCAISYCDDYVYIEACEDTKILKDKNSIYIKSGVVYEYEGMDFVFNFCLETNCFNKEMSEYVADIYNENLLSLIKDTITELKVCMLEALKKDIDYCNIKNNKNKEKNDINSI